MSTTTCTACGTGITSATATRTGGLCMICRHGGWRCARCGTAGITHSGAVKVFHSCAHCATWPAEPAGPPASEVPHMSTLTLVHQQIDLAASTKLRSGPLTSLDEWDVRSGDWSIQDGCLKGVNRHQGPGVIFSQADYPGAVMLDFEARTVPPSTHDIDWMFHASWDPVKAARGTAYVGGMPGWWDGKLGIEKSPDYKLVTLTALPGFVPGRFYHIQSGVINGHIFVFVDGVLRLELLDPSPIDSAHSAKIGFEAYASMIEIRELIVWRPHVTPRQMGYAAEF